MSDKSSVVLQAVRFPLVVLVVLIHILPGYRTPVSLSLTGESVYVFITELISHGFGRMAVPCFFFISGYLFFLSSGESYSREWLLGKWKRRVFSLLIPYVLWNIFRMLAIFAKNWMVTKAGGEPDYGIELMEGYGIWGCLWIGPINFPLWYMRDLICMCILAPVFLLLYRYIKWWTPVAFLALYMSPIEYGIQGFSPVAFFFFVYGGWLGYTKEDLVSRFQKRGVWTMIVAAALFLVATIFNSSPVYEYMAKLGCVFGVAGIFALFARFEDRSLQKMACLATPALFVYLSHMIYVVDLTNGTASRLLGSSPAGMFVAYLAKPVVVFGVCLTAFYLLKRFLPRTLSFVCGGRLTEVSK